MKKSIVALFGIALILTWVGVSNAETKIVGKTVEYTVQGVTMKSYLADDENIKGEGPGVLVVPEWWGVNAYVHRRARMLAELGYTALAVDM